MNKGLVVLFAIFAFSFTATGQTLKAGVLVIGNGNSAFAAGVQSAVSGVKTILLLQSKEFDIKEPKLNLHSGIEAEFLKRMYFARIHSGKKLPEPGSEAAAYREMASQVIKGQIDTLKNLTIIRSISYTKASRSGSGWLFKLNDGKEIKARVLINAGAGVAGDILNPDKRTGAKLTFNYTTTAYRTSLAAGFYLPEQVTSSSYLTLPDILPVLPKENDNLILANAADGGMLLGQAAGAAAACAAFFDTKTSEVKLKTIQGELLGVQLALVPLADVPNADSNWRAIQNIALMGVIKAELNNGKLLYKPEQSVKMEEIAEPLKELYYKAQIWFDDHKGDLVTLEKILSLVCYVGNKSLSNTTAEIEKKWINTYKFKGVPDQKQIVSRRVFAVILSDYLQPLSVNIDQSGRVLR